MMRYLFFIAFCLFFALPVQAQFYSTQYRLPEQSWMEIKSDHFRVIYPKIYRAEAIRSLSILEAEYENIRTLVGGELSNFPVILNPENDRSNGFVSSMNFRSEIELSPIKGKTLNPQSGDWLESVLPHELVHALHFSSNPPSLTRILGVFSPDLRRGTHGAAPAGVLEGIAVEYESHGSIPYSGRGNYPYFTNQFTSLLDTPDEWSMGQLVHKTDFTPPFDRHYIGGYEFSNWLLNEYGDDAIKRAIHFHYRFPFLGYGVALRNVTGKWPAQLYDEFSASLKNEESQRVSRLHGTTDSSAHSIPFNATCQRANRPIWINDHSILFHARSCNQTPGFYVHNTETETTSLLKEVQLSGDYYYSISENRSKLFYSRYHTDSRIDNVFRGDLHELDLLSSKHRRLTHNQRLFSPDISDRDLFALQSISQSQKLVRISTESGTIVQEFPKTEHSTVVQVAVNPANSNFLAIVGKVNGVQGIWFEDLKEAEILFSTEPNIVFEGGSIIDVHWNANGSKMLFVSDHTGVMNVYEFNVENQTLHQITRSFYNVFEPSYSPDGNSIAYIHQNNNEQVPSILNLSNAIYEPVSESEWKSNSQTRDRLSRPLMNREAQTDTTSWDESEYKTGFSWLKPRLWMPNYQKQSGYDKIGVTLESVDLMSSQSYSLDVNHYIDRLWYDLVYTHKSFFPGFQVELFNRPTITNFNITQNNQEFTQAFLQQSRGGALKIPIRFRLESNVRFSSILLEPQYYLNQTRYLDPQESSTSFSDFGTRHTIGFRTVLNLRLRQFSRDVQPNSGWVVFSEVRYGLNRADLVITTDEFSIAGNLTDRKGIRGGISTYVAPLSKWNQSLQLTAQVISQTNLPVYNTESLYTDTFSDSPFPGANNVGYFNTRYTIPLTYPDNGGLLLPVYLSNIYLVLFSQTATDLNQSNWMGNSRSVFGVGVRSRFRLSNLAFDVGFSIGWEPTRNSTTLHFGSF